MTTTHSSVARYRLWIDGAAQEAESGATFTRSSPYSGETVSEYDNGDERDAERAVASARRCFDAGTWRAFSAPRRHAVLQQTAALLHERADTIAARITHEIGKPLAQSRAEVIATSRSFQYYAGAALANEGAAISERAADALGLVYHEPVGVVAAITAWNFPMMQIGHKAAAALAAGCSLVAKPSHLCSVAAVDLAGLLHEAGLPSGVFNIVTSDRARGALVGQYLAQSHAVDMVTFTGSTAAGRAVMRAAASNVKRVQLELGGKSANIVFSDAPFDDAARSAAAAFTVFSGQQCSAGSRLLVQRDIHERFVTAVADHVRRHVPGDPLAPTTTLGPLVSAEQLARVQEYIQIGRESGTLVLGGGQPEVIGNPNLFVEPTIFDDVANSSRLAQEEVFGPVLAIIPFDTEEQAIALANESEYGLAGGVWTESVGRALRVAKAVRTGRLTVNCYPGAGITDMPHGGYKSSGIGRENGSAGLAEFQELKTIQINAAPR